MARKTQKVDTLISQIHNALSKHIDIMHINVSFVKVFVPQGTWDVDRIDVTVFYFTDNRDSYTNVMAQVNRNYFSLPELLNQFYSKLKIDDPNNNIEFSF